MRVVLILQYHGKDFCGWQIQPGLRSVQQTVEEAVEKLTGKRSSVIASGRTDSGVHALCQVAHFDTDFASIPAEKYSFALNIILPPDVKVLKSFMAPPDFHARYSAKKKTYRYSFYVADCTLPLYDDRALQIYKTDVEKMRRAAKHIVGEHDFRCFLAADSDVESTVRTVYSCDVEAHRRFIDVTVCGNGFLYNMVRTIAGTLYFAGIGKFEPDYVKTIIENRDRELAGKTLAAKGLCLVGVEYKEFNAADFFKG